MARLEAGHRVSSGGVAGALGFPAARMHPRLEDLDDFRRVEIPARQGAADRLEDRQHAAITLQRGHVRVEPPPLEFRREGAFGRGRETPIPSVPACTRMS
jgi:hypothetical protein